MNYLRKNNRQSRQFLKPFYIAVSIFTLSSISYFFWPQLFNQVLVTIARPFWEVRERGIESLEKISAQMRSKETLYNENTRLKIAIDIARNNMVGFEIL